MAIDNTNLNWACEKVSSLIGISKEECEPLIKQIWLQNSEDDIRNDFQNILGNSIATNIFINEFVSRKFSLNNVVQTLINENDGRNSPYEYQKQNAEEYYSGKKKKVETNQKNSNNNEISIEKVEQKNNNTNSINNEINEDDELKISNKKLKKEKAKKKKGGISINEWDKEDIRDVVKGKNGRPMCPCLAKKHGLVTNCLNCGKIICKLEGVGPCSFCGNEVIDNEQQIRVYQQKQRDKIKNEKQKIMSNSESFSSNKKKVKNNSTGEGTASSSSSTSPVYSNQQRPNQEEIDQQRNEKLVLKLEVQSEMDQKKQEFEKARIQKEKLLDFDRNSAERSKIYDTATDFDPNMTAAYNKWLTPQERRQAIKREQAYREYEKNLKKNVKVAIDIKTKEIIELPPDPFEYKDEIDTSQKNEENNDQGTGLYINPFIKEIPKFVKVNINEKKKEEKPKTIKEKKEEKRKLKKELEKSKNNEEEKIKKNKQIKEDKKKTGNIKKGKTKSIKRIQYDIEDQELYGFNQYDYSEDEEQDGVCNNNEPIINIDR